MIRGFALSRFRRPQDTSSSFGERRRSRLEHLTWFWTDPCITYGPLRCSLSRYGAIPYVQSFPTVTRLPTILRRVRRFPPKYRAGPLGAYVAISSIRTARHGGGKHFGRSNGLWRLSPVTQQRRRWQVAPKEQSFTQPRATPWGQFDRGKVCGRPNRPIIRALPRETIGPLGRIQRNSIYVSPGRCPGLGEPRAFGPGLPILTIGNYHAPHLRGASQCSSQKMLLS
jgi:hypothetical protein